MEPFTDVNILCIKQTNHTYRAAYYEKKFVAPKCFLNEVLGTHENCRY